MKFPSGVMKFGFFEAQLLDRASAVSVIFQPTKAHKGLHIKLSK
jgi:hypothetical protein